MIAIKLYDMFILNILYSYDLWWWYDYDYDMITHGGIQCCYFYAELT